VFSMSNISNYVIGIDIGTSMIKVGYFDGDNTIIIPNDQNSLLTPAYIAFTETSVLFGEAAKN